MRGRKNELAALATFILTVDRIEGWNNFWGCFCKPAQRLESLLFFEL
jgi:hypothetical protein